MSQMGVWIQLTEAVKKHFIAHLNKTAALGVRFSVKKTGCSGLSYVVDYVEQTQPTDRVMVLSEHYFIYIDHNSLPYLQGMTVDYMKQGMNSKLVFSNPNQIGQCGCGESFTV